MTPLGDEGQTDEIELDFDSLDAPTLWRLEAYLRSLNAGNGNFHVEVCYNIILRASLGEVLGVCGGYSGWEWGTAQGYKWV